MSICLKGNIFKIEIICVLGVAHKPLCSLSLVNFITQPCSVFPSLLFLKSVHLFPLLLTLYITFCFG